MHVFGTPPPCVPLTEAAAARSTTVAQLLADLAGIGADIVIVSAVKRAARVVDLEELEPGITSGLNIRHAPHIGPEGRDCSSWG